MPSLQERVEIANKQGSTAIKIVKEAIINEKDLTQLGLVCGFTHDYQIELEISNHLERLKGFSCEVACPISFENLDQYQTEAIQSFFNSNIVVLCGSAGSGKTNTILAIVDSLLNAGISRDEIALISPLAVIANRLSIKSGVNGYTVHRLLEFSKDDDNIEFKPKRNQENKINQSFIIIDEATLLNNELFIALLRAIPTGARLLIAGDIKQLKAIGKGDVFSCLVNAENKNKFKLVELKNNYRNNGTSIERFTNYLALSDKVGINFELNKFCDHDFIVLKTEGDKSTYDLLRAKFLKVFEHSPESVREIQILTPEHEGIVGTKSINALVKSIAKNPNGIGDRVIFKTNKYQWSIFNGQTGLIKNKTNTSTCIEVNGRLHTVENDCLWDNVELAYALTPNRCQGAEFSLVIVILPEKMTFIDVCWLYACSSRAKRSLVVIGRTEKIDEISNRQNTRTTFLSHLL